MATNLGLEETELRLGLPGGGELRDGTPTKNSGKRAFEETIDLKLKLQTTATAAEVEAASASATAAAEMKRSPSQSRVAARDAADPEKPPAPKAQVVGWPPVRSYRKNMLAVQSENKKKESEGDQKSSPSPSSAAAAAAVAFVKVCMDGAPYLRKIDLKIYRSYQELSIALEKMFSSFTGTNCGTQGMRDFMNQGKKLMDLINGCEYVPTYEDKDGDWMLVGDVPWEMFVESCKRLRIMKGSEAVGLAPSALEKCKSRS